MERGKWSRDLLVRAVDRMDREIRHCWDSAWTLHIEGFHEMELKIGKTLLPCLKKLSSPEGEIFPGGKFLDTESLNL